MSGRGIVSAEGELVVSQAGTGSGGKHCGYVALGLWFDSRHTQQSDLLVSKRHFVTF